ncbi:MAG: BolA family protein [Myxococcota bacterium]
MASTRSEDSGGNPRAERLDRCLRAALEPEHLEVVDESERHRGHPGAASGGGHFRVTLVARRFAGCSRLERHRLCYEALGSEMGREVHALALRTFTPEEWRARSGSD